MNKKGNSNLAAAQKLIDTGYYTESVHCSYYSAFQFMKYVLAYKISKPISYDEQTQYCRSVSSHEWVIGEIVTNIPNFRDGRKFNELITFLKNNRVRADYSGDIFKDIDSIDSIDTAKEIKSELNRVFKAGL